jgi:hypothetical protein
MVYTGPFSVVNSHFGIIQLISQRLALLHAVSTTSCCQKMKRTLTIFESETSNLHQRVAVAHIVGVTGYIHSIN